MNRDKKIKREVERTMQSLDGIVRAETGPFFYSRLEERFRSRETGIREVPIRRLVAAAAALIILIAINLFTVLQFEQAYGDSESNRQEYLQAFAREYELEIPTIYSTNSQEQP